MNYFTLFFLCVGTVDFTLFSLFKNAVTCDFSGNAKVGASTKRLHAV